MGVTIHYELRVADINVRDKVLMEARAFAAAQGWPVRLIDEPDGVRTRFDEGPGEEHEERGHFKGLAIQPHEDSEEVTLEFGPGLWCQNFTKTQFAPFPVHQRVVELLRRLEPLCTELVVEDESGLWETGDVKAARRLFVQTESIIKRLTRKLTGRDRGEG